MVPIRTWKHNNRTDLCNFWFVLIFGCFSVQKFYHRLSENHIKTRLSLQQFRFWSITQPEMLCHVKFRCKECCLTKTELGIRFHQPSLIRSINLNLNLNFLFALSHTRAGALSKPFWALPDKEPLNKFTTIICFNDCKKDRAVLRGFQFLMFENPRRGRQGRNFTKNVPKVLDLKSSPQQIFSEN